MKVIRFYWLYFPHWVAYMWLRRIGGWNAETDAKVFAGLQRLRAALWRAVAEGGL